MTRRRHHDGSDDLAAGCGRILIWLAVVAVLAVTGVAFWLFMQGAP